MVALSTPTLRTKLPPDGPLMALCRVPDDMRLALGGTSEDSVQGRLASLLDRRCLTWCHVHNEGQRDASARGAALRRGLKRGVPDILIYQPFRWGSLNYSGLAIEIKRGDATPCAVSDDQRRWLTELRSCGWMAEWARGYTEAERLIARAYGGG
jgi:hypothetical protein